MTFLAIIYPVLTFPYLRLWYFPFVIPLALLAEITVFLLLDPVQSKPKMFLTLLAGNLLGCLLGFGLGYLAQSLLQAVMGAAELDNLDLLIDIGVGIAVVFVGLVKLFVWTFVFTSNRYTRKIIVLTHLLCYGTLCGAFVALPYFNLIQLPNFDLPKI